MIAARRMTQKDDDMTIEDAQPVQPVAMTGLTNGALKWRKNHSGRPEALVAATSPAAVFQTHRPRAPSSERAS